jgi:hypothetical protein
MEKNLKKREFLEADKPLAMACYHRAMTEKESKLAASFKDWLDDINAQLAGYGEAA